ncbi:MAG TPA: hypothetical protein VHH12_03075 [Mycobacterium sp.]|nr:hypothetical protein [Mycobacterium sp.]
MRIWRRAFRPSCAGLFVENGVLYGQRDATDPAFRLLVSTAEQREFLEPIPVPLNNARVFLDIELGSRRPVEVPEGATVYRPAAAPRNRGDKLYTITVYTATNEVFIGYPASGGEARNMFRAIEKLVKSTQ